MQRLQRGVWPVGKALQRFVVCLRLVGQVPNAPTLLGDSLEGVHLLYGPLQPFQALLVGELESASVLPGSGIVLSPAFFIGQALVHVQLCVRSGGNPYAIL